MLQVSVTEAPGLNEGTVNVETRVIVSTFAADVAVPRLVIVIELAVKAVIARSGRGCVIVQEKVA